MRFGMPGAQRQKTGDTVVPLEDAAARAEAEDIRRLYRSINTSQAVIEFGLDGTVLKANDNFLSLFGYRLDEVVGRHHRMFADPAFAQSPAYDEFWAKLRRGTFDAGQYKRVGRWGQGNLAPGQL